MIKDGLFMFLLCKLQPSCQSKVLFFFQIVDQRSGVAEISFLCMFSTVVHTDTEVERRIYMFKGQQEAGTNPEASAEEKDDVLPPTHSVLCIPDQSKVEGRCTDENDANNCERVSNQGQPLLLSRLVQFEGLAHCCVVVCAVHSDNVEPIRIDRVVGVLVRLQKEGNHCLDDPLDPCTVSVV